MLTKPVDQMIAPDPAGCEIEHEALLVAYGSVDLGAVENEDGLHGGVSSAFVAIEERVALDQRERPASGAGLRLPESARWADKGTEKWRVTFRNE
jgi:hypothetical protein